MPLGAPKRCQEREWTGKPSECQSADAGVVLSCILNPRHLLVIHHTLPPQSQEFESTALTGSRSLAHIGESFSSSSPFPLPLHTDDASLEHSHEEKCGRVGALWQWREKKTPPPG